MAEDNTGKKIFVVDDDPSIADSISNLLKLKGYKVRTFLTGSIRYKPNRIIRLEIIANHT